MIDPILSVMILVLIFITIRLYQSKHERHAGCVFMVRSNIGIKLIDRVSKICPGFWDFLADFSVMLSMGGLGGYYLSSHSQSKKNFVKSLAVMGVIFSLGGLYVKGTVTMMLFLALTALMCIMLPRIDRVWLNFLATSALFAAAASLVVDIFTATIFGILGLPSILIYALAMHGLDILSSETDLPGVSPMIPTSKDGNLGVSFPGYDIFIPWWHALVALFITLVFHEGAHGILVRRAKVKLKSTGLLTIFSVPIGAFVEPDEKSLEHRSSVDRMRVFTMGSFANLVVGALAASSLILFTFTFQSMIYTDGMRVVGIMEGFPAEGKIPVDTIIYGIDGQSTEDWENYKIMSGKLAPNKTVVLETSDGDVEITLAPNDEEPGRGFIGVYLVENIMIKKQYQSILSMGVISYILEALGWIVFFNINIGIVNLLPVIPFDGGRMFKELTQTLKLSDENTQRILWGVVAFTAMLFFVNMFPLFTRIFESLANLI